MTQLGRRDGLVGNTAMKAPCRAATTANITLSGEQTIDGVACVADDRVLVKDQTTGADNGIYVVSTGTWERADDWDGSYDIVCGTFIYVHSGTVNASTNWRVTTADPITIGTTSVTIAAAFGSLDVPGDIHSATAKTPAVDADELGLVDSAASWVLKKITLTTLWAWIQTHLAAPGAIGGTTPAAISGTTGTFTGAISGTTILGTKVNGGKVTVASHATTADPFGAAGQFIDWTGTATTTALTAAPAAGMKVTLYCAGACAFTAGANLLIEGIQSGTTITLAAGATVEIYAITTTQFKLTYSLSGSFTATGTGFTVNPTGTATYTVENGLISLRIPQLSGTSNATSFTITGLPTCVRASSLRTIRTGVFRDNSTISTTVDYMSVTSSGTISLYKADSLTGWTAAGTKQLDACTFSYSAD